MFRQDILSIFFEHLNLDEAGRYFVELNGEVYYLDVEDTAFVVSAVYKTMGQDNGCEQIEVLLSDGCLEVLDLNTLVVGQDNVIYCRIKEGRFPARFVRKSYYQLAEFIEEDDTGEHFCVALDHGKYLIKNS